MTTSSKSEDGSRNRRARRAAAKDSGKPMEPPISAPAIKLRQPDRSKANAKTLIDLYEEQKALLEHGQPFAAEHWNGVGDEEGDELLLEAGLVDGDPIGPLGNAVFWAISLAMTHFTLDVLVYNQYSQKIEWLPILRRSTLAVPILSLLLLIANSKTAARFSLAKQILFFGIGVVAGCYVIHAANVYGYFAVMKQAPPLGTLWIWSVAEMELSFALASLMINLVFLWAKGYSVI